MSTKAKMFKADLNPDFLTRDLFGKYMMYPWKYNICVDMFQYMWYNQQKEQNRTILGNILNNFFLCDVRWINVGLHIGNEAY